MNKSRLMATIALLSFLTINSQITNSFPNDGNVGIGTLSPQAKLHVERSGTIGGTWNPTNSFLTLFDGGGQYTIMDSNEMYGSSTLHIGSRDGDVVKFRSVFDGGLAIDRMVIKSNGSVGIGTTSPAGQLDVRTTDNKGVWINRNNESAVSFWPNNGNSIFHISHGHDNRLHISTGTNVEGGELFTIVHNGAVGIGTTNPGTYKLAVKGKIRAEEIKVETGWADYVFKENYDLPTLEEVEKHIQEKGHLINIPSAKEVEENGIQLGEMNKLLLEKIEELTLYTLQQQKEIEQYKRHMARLNTKLEAIDQKINNLKN
ncbi:tail fiber protein [Flagellimonas sp. HMM57]|uniref:tail fiber protein n=1 Tax=unclassified Flagellimonas TaxID=2644544 RepID=UPI0013D34F58|nr:MULTISPECIES: tail fiber protein [unclassified Flagellimonas]UII77354.1 tail fiber protein [Flagellimonas sp. HMM57]